MLKVKQGGRMTERQTDRQTHIIYNSEILQLSQGELRDGVDHLSSTVWDDEVGGGGGEESK